MLCLEPVTGKNVYSLMDLQVAPEQETFVAPNAVSLAEAYVALTRDGHAFPFGLMDGETPVGFVMIGFDVDADWEDAPAVAYGSYNLWRLMIDRRYQGRGYGREAMGLALDFIRTFPCGPADICWLSYEPENVAAKALYASFGFVETGEFDGEEAIAVLRL